MAETYHPSPDECPNHFRVLNLEKWQKDQNGTLGRLERKVDGLTEKVDEVCSENSYRKGGEQMLKWIIGLVGFTGIVSIIGLIVGVVQ